MRSLLISGETTLIHDNYYWVYPVFQFFSENLLHGQFPLWNPFSHGGEPFYPLLFQIRLLDPTTLLNIFLGRIFTDDLVMSYHWNRYLHSILFMSGIYFVLRPWAKHHIIRIALIPILIFSSLMLGSFRQDSIINQFVWTPWITFYLLKIVYYKDYRWCNWLFLSGLVGLNWQSYFFTGTFIFFLIFFVGMLLFKRDFTTLNPDYI